MIVSIHVIARHNAIKRHLSASHFSGAASVPTAQKRPIWEIVVDIGAQTPDAVWATVPDDASINYKH